jgi:SAM-dependent methyltransferase
MLDWVRGSTIPEIIERNDGVVEVGAGPEEYLAPRHEWPECEQRSMTIVRGRVADVGCGGGRVALHLQELGLSCVGIDVSTLALKAARLNGVRSTLNLSIDHFHQRIAEFDTVILFGNNLGVFGTPERARRTLTKWAAHATPGTRILIESTSPYSGGAPILDRAYCRENLAKGLALGQCRLRVWYDRSPSKWFSWFFASPSDLKALLRGSGWSPLRFVTSASDEPYIAVYEKA